MSRDSDEYLTDSPTLALVKQIFGAGIDFDPYSSPGQLVKCRDGLTLASDPEPWPQTGLWWANIPFSDSATVMPKLAEHFARCPKISALVLCLAAPSSAYWADTIWSPKIGCRRIGWVPRMKFLRLDANGVPQATAHTVSRDIALSLWTSEDRLVSRFEKFVPNFNPGKRPRTRPVVVIPGGRK
jgi:hypothetical protein